MPHPVLHLSLAKSLADELSLTSIEADRGAYYLGSTAPDMRRLRQVPRAQTHFFVLEDFAHQDSVSTMFQAHPDLRERTALNSATVAFMSGYITHLVVDEAWINEVYRPFFGERSSLAGTPRANVMDRVLQYEMERQRREDCDTVTAISQSIVASALEVMVGSLDIDSLESWRDLNLRLLNVPPTWEPFRGIATRILNENGMSELSDVDTLMAEIPAVLAETVDHVGWDHIENFVSGAQNRCLAEIRGFLK